MKNPLTIRFEKLLLQFSKTESTEERKQIENLLWKEFGKETTVFVLDMSGFSRLTQKYGIVHYLSMVQQMRMIVFPIIQKHLGSLVKFEADNCFATFPSPLAGVQASIQINRALLEKNKTTAKTMDIHISCGIDYGKILMPGEDDFFGDPVNRACKLGEDIAGPGEILTTKTLMEQIPAEGGLKSERLDISVSGIVIETYRILYDL